jgi:hypothetical protein
MYSKPWITDRGPFLPVGLGCGVLEEDEMLPEALGELEDEAKPVVMCVVE